MLKTVDVNKGSKYCTKKDCTQLIGRATKMLVRANDGAAIFDCTKDLIDGRKIINSVVVKLDLTTRAGHKGKKLKWS